MSDSCSVVCGQAPCQQRASQGAPRCSPRLVRAAKRACPSPDTRCCCRPANQREARWALGSRLQHSQQSVSACGERGCHGPAWHCSPEHVGSDLVPAASAGKAAGTLPISSAERPAPPAPGRCSAASSCDIAMLHSSWLLRHCAHGGTAVWQAAWGCSQVQLLCAPARARPRPCIRHRGAA